MNVDFNARKNMFTLRNDEILPPTGNPRLHTVFWRSFLGFLALGNSSDWHLQTHSKKHDFLGSRICSGLLCFCIEKVVILVLIFYRKLQGRDFRTFDLSEFSRDFQVLGFRRKSRFAIKGYNAKSLRVFEKNALRCEPYCSIAPSGRHPPLGHVRSSSSTDGDDDDALRGYQNLYAREYATRSWYFSKNYRFTGTTPRAAGLLAKFIGFIGSLKVERFTPSNAFKKTWFPG